MFDSASTSVIAELTTDVNNKMIDATWLAHAIAKLHRGSMLRRLMLSTLVVACWTSSQSIAADSPGPLPPPSLAALEARAPAENTFPTVNPKFHEDAVRLVESNTLSSGDEFFRAANIISDPIPLYRSVRMRYELVLAAVGKGNHDAEKLLPWCWDALLQTLGRSMQFDVWGLVAKNPDNDQFTLDPAPKVIQSVMLNPESARDGAIRAAANAEVQGLVDADQAIRANWGKLSEEEHKAAAAADHQRNLRIREIVRAGELHTANDFANASLVMQHSSSFAGFELAHELAVCSMLLGDRGTGRWLVAATYDRMLNSMGHLQRFGTQGAWTQGFSAKPELAETDEAGICDAERLALGCPTLVAKRANFYTPKPTS